MKGHEGVLNLNSLEIIPPPTVKPLSFNVPAASIRTVVFPIPGAPVRTRIVIILFLIERAA
jgi:hypothetical protein